MTMLRSLSLIAALLTNSLPAQDRRPFLISDDPPALHAFHPSANPLETEVIIPSSSLHRTQWLMFTAEWCAPCQTARGDFEPWLRSSGWLVDETPAAHIRLVDGDRHPDLVQQQGILAFPTFVLMQGGRELWRQQGYPGRTELVRRYQDAAKSAPPAVGAISIGTLKGQQGHIADLIAVFRPLLGTDGTLTLRLDRPGTPLVVLPLGERMSIRADNPLVMNYSLQGDVLTCRFAQPYPRGRFTFGLPVEQSISAVSLSVSEAVLELPHAPDVRFKVEP